MTFFDVYVGEPSGGDDPLDWGGDPSVGNTPNAISPLFPPSGAYGGAFWVLIDKIRRGEFTGKKVDWGAWAAQVSKQQIRDFIEEPYRGNDWYTDPTLMPHLYQKKQALSAFVESLHLGAHPTARHTSETRACQSGCPGHAILVTLSLLSFRNLFT